MMTPQVDPRAVQQLGQTLGQPAAPVAPPPPQLYPQMAAPVVPQARPPMPMGRNAGELGQPWGLRFGQTHR